MVRLSRSSSAAAFASAAVAFAAFVGASQPVQALPSPDRSFDDEVEVLEVTVPVRVLRDGFPVRDLRADDFVLFDRGTQQEVRGFEILESPASLGEPRMSVAAKPLETDASVPVRRNFLWLFDLFHIGWTSANRTHQGLLELLSQPLPPGDHIAIAVHGESANRTTKDVGARLVIPFTRDLEELRLGLEVVRALRAAKPAQTRTLMREIVSLRESRGADLRDGVGDVAASRLTADPLSRRRFTYGSEGEDLGWLGTRPQVADTDRPDGPRFSSGGPLSILRWFAHATADLVTLFEDLPGQNHLVLFSIGGYGNMQRAWNSTHIQPLLHACRRTGWTLQAIDTKGRGFFYSDDLFYLANETGGELVENHLQVDEAFERIRRNTAVTYLLTFRPNPDPEGDGRHHDLEVRLRDGDWRTRVLHREGYFVSR